MPVPTVHAFPVRRPGFIVECEWINTDAQLALRCKYFDEGGTLRQVQFATRNTGDSTQGEICLPTGLLGNDLHELGPRYEDVLKAHVRMTCMVARSGIPGSDEFNEALLNGMSSNLNTALGVVKIVDVAPVNDTSVTLTFKCGTGPSLPITMDYAELNDYSFAPDTQLFVVPGSVKKQFSTYQHNFPSTVLTQTQKDNIVAYVLALQPWI